METFFKNTFALIMKVSFSLRSAAIFCFAFASLAFFIYAFVYYAALPILANGKLQFLEDDHTSWPSSSNPKPNDYTRSVLEMQNTTMTMDRGRQNSAQFIDLNGDGLNDFIYFDDLNQQNNSVRSMAIMKNKGDYSFDTVYKCYFTVSGMYYGDCAQQ